ncbi:MAG: hypothetical protein Q4G51_14315 [Dermatophilus congolensis]|nr:hypothetical protein [Dermatophilus congolensis]
MESIEVILRGELRQAMRARDAVATSAIRSALAALDNAGAVPTDVRAGAVEDSRVGAGSADVARRELSHDEARAIVQREIDERHAAAAELPLSHAEPVRAEAEVLERIVGRL